MQRRYDESPIENGTNQLNLSTPKSTCLVQESGTYGLYNPSYGQFYVQITTGYHGYKSRCDGVSLNYTIRLADPPSKPLCLVVIVMEYIEISFNMMSIYRTNIAEIVPGLNVMQKP